MAGLVETLKNILFSCCTSSPATKGHDHHVEHDFDHDEDRHAENQHLDNAHRNDGLENLRSPRNVSPAAQSTGRNVSTSPHSTEKHHPRVVEPVHEPIYSTPDSGHGHGLTIRNAEGLYHPTTRSHKSAKLVEQGSSLEIVDDGESMGSPALKYYNKFGEDGDEVVQNANFPQEDEKAHSEKADSPRSEQAASPHSEKAHSEKAASPHSEKAHSEKADSPRSEQAAAPAAHDGEKALSPRSEHAAQRESEQAALRKIMEGGDDEEQEKPRVSLASSNNSFDFE